MPAPGHIIIQRYLKHILPFVFFDAVVIVAAYGVVHSVRVAAVDLNVSFLLYAVGITLASLFVFGGYNRIWSRTSGHDVTVLLAAVSASTVLTLVPDFFLRPRPVPLSVILVGNVIALSGFVAVRYRSRLISGLAWRWRAVWHHEFPEPFARVLIVGAGASGQSTAWGLKHRAPSGHTYHVVGFIDDDPAKQGLYLEGTPVLGTRADIATVVETYEADVIVVAVHNISGPEFRDLLTHCEQTEARIKIVPDMFHLIDSNHSAPLLRDVKPEDLLGRQAVEWHKAIDVGPISEKVILVTGAAGSIGSELCHQILAYQPTRLIMLDNNESGLHNLLVELKNDPAAADKLVPVLADITHRKTLKRVFEQHSPQVIFHSAAYKHVPMLEGYPGEAVRINIGGTLQCAGLARDYAAERFVLISTDKAVNPSCVMGATKRMCEMIMHALSQQRDHNTLFTSVRFGNVLGSRGSVVPTFTRQIEAGGPVTVTDRDMSRYFMTIPEAVNLVVHAACLTQGDDLFMLRMGDQVRIVELAERMIRLRGLRPYHDIPIEFTGVRPGEKLHEQLHDATEQPQPTIHPGIIELISRRNGLRPVGYLDQMNTLFEQGLDDHVDALSQLLRIIAHHRQVETCTDLPR